MIQRWDIITIGNLSRNRYWGEADAKAMRPPLCTCTLIQGEGLRLLVDPSLADAFLMAAELDRRAGIKPDAINHVFITHAHQDHYYGLKHFTYARWLAPAEVARTINTMGAYGRTVEAVGPRIRDVIEVITTPGHAPDHHSLRFECEGQRIVVAGDAVMNHDFFRDRRSYFNSVNHEQAVHTIDMLAKTADVIVPGHDNYFVVRR